MRDWKEWQRLLHKKIQMEAARELVEHTGLKTYEIGERVGYVNANYFSCLFKRRYQTVGGHMTLIPFESD